MNISHFKRMVSNYLLRNASQKEAALLSSYLDRAWEEKQIRDDVEEQRIEVWRNLQRYMTPPHIRVWRYAAAVLILVAGGTTYSYRFAMKN